MAVEPEELDPAFEAFKIEVNERGKVIHSEIMDAYLINKSSTEISGAVHGIIRVAAELISTAGLPRHLFDQKLNELLQEMKEASH